MLAEAAAFAAADVARDVHFGTGLGERKVARAQPNLGVGPEKLAGKGEKHLFEVGERDIFVDVKTLELMEKAVCTGRDSLVAIHSPGTNHADRRLLPFHDSALVVRRMRTQNYVFRHLIGVGLDEKGVLHVACGMVGGEVQFGKYVQVVVDLGPFGQRKAHALENIDDLIAHDCQRMARS